LIVNPVNLSIGDSTFINVDCLFEASGTIVIGRQCWFGPRVMVLTSNHVGEERALEFLPVTVGDRVWIGAGATIVPGVTIGNDAVVAAGSVVTKNLLANARVAGIPARAM
jgi:maltose O-acetyltransferase